MKKLYKLFLIFSLFHTYVFSQDTTVTISTKQLDINQSIKLKTGWVFNQGDDPSWADPSFDASDWKNISQLEFGRSEANKEGRLEGWLRLKIKIDSSMANMPLYFGINNWQASEIFLDGKKIRSYGRSAANKHDFRYNKPTNQWYLNFVQLSPGSQHTIAIHFVHYFPDFPFNLLYQNNSINVLPILTGPAFLPKHTNMIWEYRMYNSFWITASTALVFLFWLLYFQNRSEKNLLLIAIDATFFLASMSSFTQYYSQLSYSGFLILRLLHPFFNTLMIAMIPLIIIKVFTRKVSPVVLLLLFGMFAFGYIFGFSRNTWSKGIILLVFSSILIKY